MLDLSDRPTRQFRRIATRSADEAGAYLTEALARRLDVAPLMPGPFEARISARAVGGLRMSRSHFLFGATASSTETPDNFSAFIVGAGGQVHRQGTREHRIAPREAFIVNTAILDETRIEPGGANRFVDFRLGDAETMLERILDRQVRLPSDIARKVQAGSIELRRISSVLSATDEIAIDEQDGLSPTAYTSRLIRDAALMALVEALPIAQTMAETTQVASPAPWQIRRAVAFITAQTVPVTIHEVADVVGVGVRALQIAFLKHEGVTPNAYIKRVRLEAARRALSNPDGMTTVSTVARHWGFLNTGKFASDYAALFGHLPSETLNQKKAKTRPARAAGHAERSELELPEAPEDSQSES